MPKFNRNFELTIEDIDLIEEALRVRGRELCSARRALVSNDPADLVSIRVIDEDLARGEELLGKIHNQKIFYRPTSKVYVGG